MTCVLVSLATGKWFLFGTHSHPYPDEIPILSRRRRVMGTGRLLCLLLYQMTSLLIDTPIIIMPALLNLRR